MQRLRAATRQAQYALTHRHYRPASRGEISVDPLPATCLRPRAPRPWIFAPTMDFCTQGSDSDRSQLESSEPASSESMEVVEAAKGEDTAVSSQKKSKSTRKLAEEDDDDDEIPDNTRISKYWLQRGPLSLAEYDPNDTEVDPYYSDDNETLNMLDTGDERNPLPLYKAREMVDFQLSKNRCDGIEVITDPELEESLKEMVVEEVDDFIENIHAILRNEEISRKMKKEKLAKKSEVKLISEQNSTIDEGIQEKNVKDSSDSGLAASEIKEMGDEGSEIREVKMSPIAVESKEVETTSEGSEIKEVERANVENGPVNELQDASKDDLIHATGQNLREAAENEVEESSNFHEALEIKEEVAVQPETKDSRDMKGERDETTTLDEDESDEQWVETVGVVEFGRRLKASYEEEQKALEEAKSKEKLPSLRWETRLVLGPGGAWHPANRKVKVSLYVKELCLSKYARTRLLALVGKRYNTNKDELTIVSERYKHRYENQKDVCRILKDLIEEARNADDLVKDAKKKFKAEFRKANPSIAGGLAQAAITAS